MVLTACRIWRFGADGIHCSKTDAGRILEMAVVDLFSGFNKLINGLQVERDEKPWHG